MIYSFIITTDRKDFMREYHIPAAFSLYDFRRFIENDLDFDDSQQGAFFLLNSEGKKIECYSLFDTGNGTMDSVNLIDMSNKEMSKLLYTFDFFNKRSLCIEFTGETEALPRTDYPLVAQSKGAAPGQFSDNPPEDEFPKIQEEEDGEEMYYDDYDEV
ncbi:MAG: hypothetical protein LBD59_07250 [Prevotellaceae bacterium]|jgi:hypothetical protein|nr:hypothetical protein [Prevotellaceae bacterium]